MLRGQATTLLQVILGPDLDKRILHRYAGSGCGKIDDKRLAHGGLSSLCCKLLERYFEVNLNFVTAADLHAINQAG